MTEEEAWEICNEIDKQDIPIMEKRNKIDALDLEEQHYIGMTFVVSYEQQLETIELELVLEHMRKLIGKYFVKKDRDKEEYIAVKDLTAYGLWGKKIVFENGIFGKSVRVSIDEVYNYAQEDGESLIILKDIKDFLEEYKEISEEEFESILSKIAEKFLDNEEPVKRGKMIDDADLKELRIAKKEGWFSDLEC